MPLAGYLIFHLLTQASALAGPRAYAAWADGEPTAFAPALEILMIYLPLLLYVGLGLRRWARAAPRPAESLGLSPSVRTSRAVGVLPPALVRSLHLSSFVVLVVFLSFHVAEFRWPFWTGALAPSDYYPELCASLSSTRWGGVPAVAIGYLLGVAAAALHCAHGLYRAALELDLVGAAGAPLLARCCAAFGLALFGLGALIVIDLATGSVLIHLPGS